MNTEERRVRSTTIADLSLDELAGILPRLHVPVEEMPAIAWDDWAAKFAEKRQ